MSQNKIRGVIAGVLVLALAAGLAAVAANRTAARMANFRPAASSK